MARIQCKTARSVTCKIGVSSVILSYPSRYRKLNPLASKTVESDRVVRIVSCITTKAIRTAKSIPSRSLQFPGNVTVIAEMTYPTFHKRLSKACVFSSNQRASPGPGVVSKLISAKRFFLNHSAFTPIFRIPRIVLRRKLELQFMNSRRPDCVAQRQFEARPARTDLGTRATSMLTNRAPCTDYLYSHRLLQCQESHLNRSSMATGKSRGGQKSQSYPTPSTPKGYLFFAKAPQKKHR